MTTRHAVTGALPAVTPVTGDLPAVTPVTGDLPFVTTHHSHSDPLSMEPCLL